MISPHVAAGWLEDGREKLLAEVVRQNKGVIPDTVGESLSGLTGD